MIYLEVLIALYFLWGFVLAMFPICFPKVAKEAIDESEYNRLEKNTMNDLFDNHKVAMFILTVLFGGIGTIAALLKGYK